MAGLFQPPSLTRMLVCEAWTKREWEMSRTQSLVLVWPETLRRFRCSSRLAFNVRALSLTLIHLPTFAASNALEFCLNTIRIYGDVRNDFQRFAENFGRRTDDLQLLPKLSKDCWRFQKTTPHYAFGHSKLENSNTTFSVIYTTIFCRSWIKSNLNVLLRE